MSNDASHVLVGTLILLAAALKLLQLRRAEPGTNRLAVLAMCGAVGLIGVAMLQESLSVIGVLDAHLGTNFAYAQRHTPILVSFGCLPVALLCWTRPAGEARRRRVVASIAVLVAVVALRWVLAAVAPPADAAAALVGDWTHAPRTAFAVALFCSYAAATLGSASVMAYRWARVIRPDRPSTAWGLRILVVSGISFGIYLVHKIAFMTVVLGLRIPPPYNPEVAQNPIVILCCVTLAAGLSTPLVASLSRRARERLAQLRAVRRLRPLWEALTAHNPGVVMPLTPSWLPARLTGAWDALDPREVEFRLFRRTIECWDVLANLHGHLDAHVQSAALDAAREAGAGDRAPATAVAVTIRRALARAEAGASPLDPGHRAEPPMRDGELAANVAWWQQVSAEWDAPLTVRLATTARNVSTAA